MSNSLFEKLKAVLSRRSSNAKNDYGYHFQRLWNDFDRRTSGYDIPLVQPTQYSHQYDRILNWYRSIDYSGYTREKALLYLISHYQLGDENRILLRLSDWVPQVQCVAQEWIINNLDNLSFQQLAENQQLFLYLSRKEMLKENPAIETINRALIKKVSEVSKGDFFKLDRKFRRYLLDLSLRGEQSLRPWVLDDPDPFARLLLLKLCPHREMSKLELSKIKLDPSVFVSRQYILNLLLGGAIPSKDELILYALDTHRGLRDLARYYLDKYYSIDVYSMYASRKDDLFYYIADYSKQEDIEHFLKGVNSHSRVIRRLCIQAVIKADWSRLKEIEIGTLLQTGRACRKLVCEYLPKVYSYDELRKLQSEFETCSPNGASTFLKMNRNQSYWQAVNAGLDMLLENPVKASSQSYQNTFRIREVMTSIRPPAYLYETVSDDLRELITQKILNVEVQFDLADIPELELIKFCIPKS